MSMDDREVVAGIIAIGLIGGDQPRLIADEILAWMSDAGYSQPVDWTTS